jgi:phosphotransferase system  glucose/maltose/N-acetylglucosamine-specific IIC component
MNWKTFATAVLLTLTQILMIIIGIILGCTLLYGVWHLLKIIWSGVVWIYMHSTVEGFIWFVGGITIFIILAAWVSKNYSMAQRSTGSFWDKVFGSN